MSRVGKKPIKIPEGVEVKLEREKISVKGPKGEISMEVRPEIKVELKDGEVLVSPKETKLNPREGKRSRAFWGLTRALIANLIKGVTEGFEKQLEIQGVGFKAALEKEELVLHVGFSNPVRVKIPQGIQVSIEKNIIKVAGFDRGLVGQVAANIRKVKEPEPYKGKGIRYVGEVVRRKVGKKAAGTTA
ncbi:MAG: 50S ribosomal protein L6 [bacterium]|nr:50S ribosomal protein L6 [bacterium]